MFTPKEISWITFPTLKESKDKNYSKERQEIRKYIREDNQTQKWEELLIGIICSTKRTN